MVRNVFYQDLKTSPNQESKVGVKDGVTESRDPGDTRQSCENAVTTLQVLRVWGRLWLRVSTWIICIQPNWICLTKGYRKVNQPTRREKEDSCNHFLFLYDGSSDGFTSAKIRDFWTPPFPLSTFHATCQNYRPQNLEISKPPSPLSADVLYEWSLVWLRREKLRLPTEDCNFSAVMQ